MSFYGGRFLLLALFLFYAAHVVGSNFVYLMNFDGTITVLDAANNHAQIAGSPFGTNSGGGPSVAVVISPDGKRCYAAGWQGSDTISIFDVNSSTGALTPIPGSPFTIPGTAPFSVVVSPDNSRIYVTFSATNQIAQYDSNFNPIGMPVSTGMASPHGIAIDLNSNIYVVYTDTGEIDKFDANLNHVVGPVSSGGMNPGGTPYAVTVNAMGTFIYVSNATTSEIVRFDPNLNPLNSSTSTLLGPIGMSLNQAGTVIYVANTGSSDVSVLDATSLVSIQPNLSSQGNNCYACALNPAETLLYTTNGGSAPTPLSVRDVNNSYTPISGSPFPSALAQYFIAFSPRISSGQINLSGSQKKNDFGLIYELFNQLNWSSVIGSAGYNIYRNGEKIASLSSTTLKYEDHNRPKGVVTLYSVTSFDSNGNESDLATIQIP